MTAPPFSPGDLPYWTPESAIERLAYGTPGTQESAAAGTWLWSQADPHTVPGQIATGLISAIWELRHMGGPVPAPDPAAVTDPELQ